MYKLILPSLLVVTLVSARPQPEEGLTPIKGNQLHYLYFPTSGEQVEIVYNDTQSLLSANLKPAVKTLLLLDGLTSFANTAMYLDTVNTFAGRSDVNVIVVDWSKYSGYGVPLEPVEQGVLLYFYVLMTQLPQVGSDLADFIQFLHDQNGVSYKDITIIGHSLGCHAAGATGKALKSKYNQTVGRIIGEDPSLQLTGVDAFVRLHIGDADVVEIYNTNRGYVGDVYPATGDVMIYVNGGDNQPCDPPARNGKGEEIGILCHSHTYSYKIYNYLAGNDTIKACPCRGATCLCQGCEFHCEDSGISVGPHIPEDARGSYHVKTGYVPW